MTRVPFGIVRALMHEMPALQAERILSASQASSIGSGAMKPQDVRSTLARLQRVASGNRASQKPPADPRVLESMGIAIRLKDPVDGH